MGGATTKSVQVQSSASRLLLRDEEYGPKNKNEQKYEA
jgi:hypothetical protein